LEWYQTLYRFKSLLSEVEIDGDLLDLAETSE
jgi:hypothetical protein